MKREKVNCLNCGKKMYPRRKSLFCYFCSRRTLKATAKLLLIDESNDKH